MTRTPTRSTLFPYTTLFRSYLGSNGDARSVFQSGRLSEKPGAGAATDEWTYDPLRSEEHTSELQSHVNLVCRLLLEKKKHGSCQENHEHRLRPSPKPAACVL